MKLSRAATSVAPRSALAAAALFMSLPPAEAQTEPSATEFVSHLASVTQRQTMRGLALDLPALDALAQGDYARAVEVLSASAAQGSRPANVALIRIQHACVRIVQTPEGTDPATIEKLRAELPEQRARHILAVLDAQVEPLKKAKASCQAARFNLGQIEARLRQAAEQGDPVSATELARYTNDPARREAMLIAAAAGNHAPAQHALAQSRVIGVQRGLSTENVASIRVLLKQAGQTLPSAKLDFANCVAVGCDGHPADAPTAAVFGIDAARDGEPAAFPAIMRMPWRGRLKPEEIVAWQYFGDRLNEKGCTGSGYVGSAISFAQTLAQIEKGIKPEFIAAGKQLTEKYWSDYGARAMKEQLCE